MSLIKKADGLSYQTKLVSSHLMYVSTVHLFCLRKHLTPSIVAPRGKVTVDIRKSTAQQLGVYGSRFPMASTVMEFSATVIHSNLSQDANALINFLPEQ